MTRLNTKPKGQKTTNYMGEPAYILHTKERLLNLAATCMFGEPKYYGGKARTEIEIFKACDECNDPEFILKLARYLRTELYLRTTPVALLIKVANMPSQRGTGLVARYAPLIVQRADEILEALAGYIKLFGKPIPNSLKKGIARAFHNFDEYQFAKYNRNTDMKFKDALRICHPIPDRYPVATQSQVGQSEQSLFKKIITGTLATPYTWEVELSKGGNKAHVWDELIRSKKLGYMATLRNLRNMLKAGTTELEMVANFIQNENAVRNSRQLPIRYLSAYEAVFEGNTSLFESDSDKVKLLADAVQNAIHISVKLNIPRIQGKTVITCDNSGSARDDWRGKSRVSLKSVRTMADAGNLLGLMAWYASDDTSFSVFGDKLIFVKPDRDKGILENFRLIDNAGEQAGSATETGVFALINYLTDGKIHVDRIIVCSDLQIGDGKGSTTYNNLNNGKLIPDLVKEYRAKVNPDCRYYSVCFNGYGTNVIVGPKTALINGWSDRIFKFINTFEQDTNAQLKYIDQNY